MNKLLFLFLLLLLVICLYFSLTISESFSDVSLEKQRCLYNNYRDLIDGRAHNSQSNSRCLDIPYTINTNCFTNKYNKCRRNDLNRIRNNMCKEAAIEECVVANRPLFNL
jgi:hypothetical protein